MDTKVIQVLWNFDHKRTVKDSDHKIQYHKIQWSLFCWFGIGFVCICTPLSKFSFYILSSCGRIWMLPPLQCSADTFSHLILCGDKMRRLIKGQSAYVTCCICGMHMKTWRCDMKTEGIYCSVERALLHWQE